MTRWFFLLFIIALSSWNPAYAGLIRDAEIEATLRDYAEPIFKAAGLKPSAVHIHLVQDDSLNAFVAGGSNLFLHTGMIIATKTPDMLLGVIAHETGHIAGGHLAQGREQLKNAQFGTIIATVLGAAATVATGKPEAAAAVITGTGSSMQRNFFAFTRTNESAADQAALRYLDQLGISAEGMVKVFELLKRQERQQFGAPDPYLRTHPLTGERITHIRNHVETANIKDIYSATLAEKHDRMLAKLIGFLETPEKTLRIYSANDNSVAAKMARAVAFFRMAQMKQSYQLMDALVSERPKDPYLHDLYGQILFESGDPTGALSHYKKAIAMLPGNALLLVDTAKAEIAVDGADNIKSAIMHLEQSTARDKQNSLAWRLLATAYGKQGEQGFSHLALAEEALLQGNVSQAVLQSDLAIGLITPDSPKMQRAKDVKDLALRMQREQKEAQSLF